MRVVHTGRPPTNKGKTMKLGHVALAVTGVTLGAVICGAGTMALVGDNDRVIRTTPSLTANPTTTAPTFKGKPNTIGEGLWKVGVDVSPGEYRTTGGAPGAVVLCYWHTAKTSGDEAIVDQGVVDSINAPSRVTLRKGQYFKTNGCRDWVKDDAEGANWLDDVFPPKVSEKKTYVIESLPAGWPVKKAMTRIDRHTGSDWVMARKCPKGAHRCIFVKPGNLVAPRLAEVRNALNSRVTVLVDLPYAKPRLNQGAREWVLTHEFGHAAGLVSHHTKPGNLMYPNTKTRKYGLSASQKRQMSVR